jgi:hypothetical protein
MVKAGTSPKMKKAYAEPTLRVYGNIESLTATQASLPNTDTGSMKNSKSS